MTLLEAIASGKPFRRKNSSKSFCDNNFQNMSFTKDEILSGDWEVSSEMVKVDIQDVRNTLIQSFTTAQVNGIINRIKSVVK